MKKLLNIITVLFLCKICAQQSDFSHINFKKADSIATSYKHETLSNLPLLAFNLTENLATDVEKFRAIYFWVCTNIKIDFDLTDLHESQTNRYQNQPEKLKQWTRKINGKMVDKLIKNKSTICTGYAYIIKALCDLANIECQIVNGYGRLSHTDISNFTQPNHSWNAINLNNKWYLVDATWSSGIQNSESLLFEFQYSNGYFLTHPKLFAINHFPVDKKWLLLGNETYTFKQFLKAPIVYKNGFNTFESLNNYKQLHKNISMTKTCALNYTLKNNINAKELKIIVDNGYTSKQLKSKIVTYQDNFMMFMSFIKMTI